MLPLTIALALVGTVTAVSIRTGRAVLWGRLAGVLIGGYLAGGWLHLWPLDTDPARAVADAVIYLLGG